MLKSCAVYVGVVVVVGELGAHAEVPALVVHRLKGAVLLDQGGGSRQDGVALRAGDMSGASDE